MSLSRRDFSLATGGLALNGCAAPLTGARGRPQRCLPFDEQLQSKPVRAAIADVLSAMPAR